MPRLKYYSLTILLVLTLSAESQEQTKIPSAISLAFKSGNAAELAKYFNTTVQILLLGKDDFYKKNVAETILKDFFAEYQSRDFVIKHDGGGTSDARYAIGNLKTDKGEFRVYFLLKKVGSELLIHQIRIEPDEGK